jgi:hypothetical protein
MEEWFHDSNDKDEVNNSRGEISKVLTSLQKFFPRPEHTNGYRLPKTHGMTKMQLCIKRFGSGMNFYGGPGEAAHKTFVKSAGQKTQKRVGKFAQQTAHQYYNYMLSTHAMQHLAYVSSCLIQSGTKDLARQPDIDTDEEDDVHINLSGKYEHEVTHEIIEKMETNQTIDVVWLMGNAKKTNSRKYKLKKELVQCLVRKINDSTENIMMIVGHTRAIVTSSITNKRRIFHSHPCYKGEPWYDQAMVHFEETNNLGDIMENYYPSRLLGFITKNSTQEVLIQCSVNPIQWNTMQQNFIVKIQLGRNFNVSFVTMPIESIVHPLCIFPDDGDQTDKYFVVLPKENWNHFFGNNVVP